VPQKQNTICKSRAQYAKRKAQNAKRKMQNAKRNCAFEILKAHCAATINAKNASFHKQVLKRNFLK
jgi:hypothetical protein